MRYLTKMVNRHWGAWPVHGVRPGSREAPTKNKTLAVFRAGLHVGPVFSESVERTHAGFLVPLLPLPSLYRLSIDNSSIQK